MIEIWGNGLAGLAVSSLLRKKDIESEIIAPTASDSNQPLLLGADTVDLVEDLFDVKGALWKIGHFVGGRTVVTACGDVNFVSAPSLSIRMRSIVQLLPEHRYHVTPSAKDRSFALDATGRNARIAQSWHDQCVYQFGKRKVLVAECSGRLSNAIMQMTEDGWLFAFPIDSHRVILQAMTLFEPVQPDLMLQNLVDRYLTHYIEPREFCRVSILDAAPQCLKHMVTEQGLALGSAAFSMDPICGDGTGATIRSAILAAAVVEECRANDTFALAHYQSRLRSSFEAHLSNVSKFYNPLTKSLPWVAELRSTYAESQFSKLASENRTYGFQYTLNYGRLTRAGDVASSKNKDDQYA